MFILSQSKFWKSDAQVAWKHILKAQLLSKQCRFYIVESTLDWSFLSFSSFQLSERYLETGLIAFVHFFNPKI